MSASGARAGQLVRPASEQRAGVDSSEAEAIGDRVVHRHRPGLVCDEVNPVAGRIGRAQIERRRCHLIPERQDREDGTKPAGRAEQVSGRRFRCADSYREIAPEHALDRFDLTQVAYWRGGRMRIEMTNLARRNPCLGNCDLHGSARTVAVLRTGRDVVSIRGRAVADELGERFCAARKRVAQFLDDQDAGSFAHDEAVPRHVERSRGLSRRLIEAGGKRACGSKTTETDDVHACFRSTAHGDVGFIGADKTSRIADRLDAGRARRHRRAQRPFEAMADRDVARREIHQEGRYRKR